MSKKYILIYIIEKWKKEEKNMGEQLRKVNLRSSPPSPPPVFLIEVLKSCARKKSRQKMQSSRVMF